MVWLRRFEDFTNDERTSYRRLLCETLWKTGADSNLVSQVDSLLKPLEHYSNRNTLNKDAFIWIVTKPALRGHPNLLRGLNRYVSKSSGLGVSCSDDIPVNSITILDPYEAEIIALSPRSTPPIVSSRDLRSYVRTDDHYWERIMLDCESDKSSASCLLELLQWERDNHGRDESYRRLVSRRQLLLSKRISRVPPSMQMDGIKLLNNETARSHAFAGFGSIHQGMAGDQVVCIKVIRIDAPNISPEISMKSVLREIVPWSRLNHQNILPFYGVSFDLFKGQIAIITPWFKNGTVGQYLSRNPHHERMHCVRDVIAGLTQLHNSMPPIYHKDIKSANILVDDRGVCCIADFGLASIAGSQRVESQSIGAGTLRYRAPELLMPPHGEHHPDYAAGDMWALGCVIYEIYTGNRPYHQHYSDPTAMKACVIDLQPPGQIPPYCPSVVRQFVRDCWAREPMYRPKLTNPHLSSRYSGLF